MSIPLFKILFAFVKEIAGLIRLLIERELQAAARRQQIAKRTCKAEINEVSYKLHDCI